VPPRRESGYLFLFLIPAGTGVVMTVLLLLPRQPRDHHTIKADLFKTIERELVFDIDLSDYDDVSTASLDQTLVAPHPHSEAWAARCSAFRFVRAVRVRKFAASAGLS
jgi:hypothetical protein